MAMRLALLPLVCLTFLASPALAVQLLENPKQEKGTYLGVLFSPVPEAVLAHLPMLPREGGVIVTHVLPKSPAAESGLQRHDILLKYNKTAIRDCNHFAELIQMDRPGSTVSLTLIRQGKSVSMKAKLRLGPVLRIARGESRGSGDLKEPPSVAKQGGPGKLSVAAEPMDGNRMKVTFEFYHEGSGRLRKVTCTGTPDSIDEQVKKLLPTPIQSLADVALKRLRALNFQRQPGS